jgi:lipid-binding SYLF domain-containing protein
MKGLKILFVAMVFLYASQVQASQISEEYLQAQSLVDSSTNVVRQFEIDPGLKWFKETVKNAKALLIIPQNLKGGFFVGGSGGSGLMIARDEERGVWGYPVFYTMGAISLGFQIGAESSQIILMIMSDKGMKRMLSTSVKLGADLTMATGPVGAGAKAVTADILAYARSQGAFAGVSLEGAVIKTRDDWNSAYYKKKVDPAEVVLLHSVTNPEANKLIKAVTQLTDKSDQ